MYTHAFMGKTVKAVVAGANGYAGMTLVHLLARHPGVELSQLTSRSFAGQPFAAVFPLLELAGELQLEVVVMWALQHLAAIAALRPHREVEHRSSMRATASRRSSR